ncbi:MAG: anthranilate synthase component I [Planctomycetota bacterium]
MPPLERDRFIKLVSAERARRDTEAVLAVPLAERIIADQIGPVLAYRRLVAPDPRSAPSFLLESVEGGERQGRYSLLGARPVVEVTAHGQVVAIEDRREQQHARPQTRRDTDPLLVLRSLASPIKLCAHISDRPEHPLPACPLGGWFGYAAYDTVRYAEPEKLDRRRAPHDDRALPDMHFGLYDGVIAFDHVAQVAHAVQLAMVGPNDDIGEAWDRAHSKLTETMRLLREPSDSTVLGVLPANNPAAPMASNTSPDSYRKMVDRAIEYIRAGDIFQVVLGQRFERDSHADPFDVYRALRSVNPSPYMVYLQAHRSIIVSSSPEILCRVRTEKVGGESKRVVTNRPLAGTRPRGATPEDDAALEADLLADEKERAEHVMLVDLGRNDVGRVAKPGSVELDAVMTIERYSHVMHISSTVTGELREGYDAWDALRAALPVGTISGAPKIRAMQIIDELEPVRRGPYGGGLGYVDLNGEMDIALALRTIVVPTDTAEPMSDADVESALAANKPLHEMLTEFPTDALGRRVWTYHVQAAAGIVADSDPERERRETVDKAAALARAIDVAETAFPVEDAGLGNA